MSFLVWECLYFYSLRPFECVTCHLTCNDCKAQQNSLKSSRQEIGFWDYVLRWRFIDKCLPSSCVISAELTQPVSPCLLCRVGEGRAYWSLGNAHTALGNHQQAMYFAEKHLEIAKEVTVYIFTSSLRGKVATTIRPTPPSTGYMRDCRSSQALNECSICWIHKHTYIKKNILEKDKRHLCCCSHRLETKVERWQPGWTCQICGWLWA